MLLSFCLISDGLEPSPIFFILASELHISKRGKLYTLFQDVIQQAINRRAPADLYSPLQIGMNLRE
jgi:hypothetical protein